MEQIGTHQLYQPAPGMKLHHIESSLMFVNTFILIDEASGECAVIDPGFSNAALFEYLQAEPLKVKYIIATHGHGDHVALMGSVKEQFGGDICIHAGDANVLEKAAERGIMRAMQMEFAQVAAPDIILQDGDKLQVGSLTLDILHTPGHSPGGICIKASPYLITGDTLFWNDVGRTDFQGGSPELLRHSISVVLGSLEEDLQVLPGHEGFTTLDNEKANNNWFKPV